MVLSLYDSLWVWSKYHYWFFPPHLVIFCNILAETDLWTVFCVFWMCTGLSRQCLAQSFCLITDYSACLNYNGSCFSMAMIDVLLKTCDFSLIKLWSLCRIILNGRFNTQMHHTHTHIYTCARIHTHTHTHTIMDKKVPGQCTFTTCYLLAVCTDQEQVHELNL